MPGVPPFVGAWPLPAAGPEVTTLSSPEEIQFRLWAAANGLRDVDHPDSHYDYRGFWKQTQGAPHPPGAQMHFPDTFKQHGHPSFSVESRYSRGLNDGGQWLDDTLMAPPLPSHLRGK